MEVRFHELEEIIDRLSALEKMIESIGRKITPAQEWYDLKSACRLKGINYNTVISNPKYQPNHGKPDAVICGRRRWRRETIFRWLEVTDEGTLKGSYPMKDVAIESRKGISQNRRRSRHGNGS